MDALHETSIKCSQFNRLTLVNKMFSKAVVLFVLLAVAVAERPRVGLRMPPIFPFTPQVVGGEEAPVGRYPFIVSLQARGQHFCAGSILNENWILTAGHCAAAISANLITVKAGKHNIARNEATEQSVKVSRSIIHDDFGGGVGPNDIAVLKLASPLKFTDRVQAVKYNSGSKPTSGEAWLCGWGSTSTSRIPRMPNELQHVKMEYIDLTTCYNAVKRLTGSSPVDQKSNICTGPLNNQISACSGDSGGPLMSRNGDTATLTGIVSWGIVPCGSAGAPSVYTDVSEFNGWIQEQIGKY